MWTAPNSEISRMLTGEHLVNIQNIYDLTSKNVIKSIENLEHLHNIKSICASLKLEVSAGMRTRALIHQIMFANQFGFFPLQISYFD